MTRTPAPKTLDSTLLPAESSSADISTPAARLMTALAIMLAIWVGFTFAFTPLRSSHDEFWHLKAGQIISENGLPQYDVFTTTAAHIEWHNHEWLTQIAMWRVYQFGEVTGLGGWRAVIALKTLCIVLAFVGFGALLSRRMREPVLALLSAAICCALARRTFYPRPPYVSYLILAALFWMLIEWRAGRLRGRWLLLFWPVFALWANLHGGWLAGLILGGAFWLDRLAGWITTVFKSRDKENRADLIHEHRAAFGWLTVIGLGSALCLLINPYGYRLFEIFYRVMGDAYLMATIGELGLPDWRFVWVLEASILIMLAAALRPTGPLGFAVTAAMLVGVHYLLRWPVENGFAAQPWGAWLQWGVAILCWGVAIVRTRAPGWPAHLMLVAFFGQQGIHHVRHLSLLGIFLLPSLAWALEGWAAAIATRWSAGFRSGAVGGVSGTPARHATPLSVLSLLVLALATGWWSFATATSPLLPSRELPSPFTRNLTLLRGQSIETSRLVIPHDFPWAVAPHNLAPGLYAVPAYPVHAVDFILRAELPAPLFNGGNYAGYLIWRLAPETMRVFTDNRYDVYGGIAIREEHAVLRGLREGEAITNPDGSVDPEKWISARTVLDKWNIQTAILPVDAPGNAIFAEDKWARVWAGPQFNIWVRPTPANQPTIERALALPRPNVVSWPGR